MVPEGEVRRQGLFFLRATLLFSTSSPPLPAVSSTCDTTDSLTLHYPYTSLSPCAASSHVPSCCIKTGTWTRCPDVRETMETRPHGVTVAAPLRALAAKRRRIRTELKIMAV